MAANARAYAQMAVNTAKQITGSHQSWTAFLTTAARLFKYPYSEQLMNKGYRDVAKTFLPNAKIVIDRFHVVRYCTWALDNVRRSVQKSLTPATRKYFKRSRKLLTSRRSSLSEEDKAAVDVILNFSEKLYPAYALKELFFELMDAKSSSAAAELLSKWLDK